MIETIVAAILHVVESLGYLGIFLMTTLESTFLPIPSEITMIPAGYLIYQGKMEAVPVFILSVAGTLTGALINYWIAYHYGRKLLVKHPKIFMMSEEKLAKMESFFIKHGSISIFMGRLVFGVRHYISFPAGLAKMDLKKFILYTTLGGSIWTATLLGLGFAFGGNEALLAKALPIIKTVLFLAVVAAIALYAKKHKKKLSQIAD